MDYLPKEKFDKVQWLIEGIYRPYDPVEVIDLMHQAGFSHAWFETRDFVSQKISYTGKVVLGEK